MDERYLYFAMADPHVFDVPWSGHEPQPLSIADVVPSGWERRSNGPWQGARPPGARLPTAGWKLHVATTVSGTSHVLRTFARTCVELGVSFKVLRGRRLVRAGHLKYAPRTASGKAGTAYPMHDEELIALVDILAVRLADVAAPTIPGDLNHPCAPLGLRWGSFVERWVEAPDGRTLPDFRFPGPPSVGDRRDDRNSAPPVPPSALADRFAPLPDQPLPLEDVAVLHRSNAGGVYRARLTSGRPVVLKEARHHTGLDGDDVDAVTRLHHECAALEALSGAGVAPEVVDVWRRADADFLVVEHVNGPNLARVIGHRHPAGIPWSTTGDRAVFDAWAGDVLDALCDLVRRMRARRVVHSDLQPANVVVGPDGLRLVDFEGAVVDGHAATKAIGTPGYVPPPGDPRDRDAFAVERIGLVLREPDALLLDRRPDLEARISGGHVGSAPGADEWRRRLVEGMLARATPKRTDRLFSGGVEQFTTSLGSHDLASGAAGVLLALDETGHDVDPALVDWLAAVPERAPRCRGLFEGVDGVAVALARLGRSDDAARLAAGLVDDQPGDLSWARGRAGVSVALAELATRLDDDRLRGRATAVVHDVVHEVEDAARGPRAPGLLGGWAGVAVGLLRAGELLDVNVRATARTALRREVDGLTRRGDCLVALPMGRVRTGLAHGSAAALLALAFLHADEDEDLAAAREPLAATLRRTTSPVAGLLEGLAGEVAVLSLTELVADVAARRERCTWHCVMTPRGWSTLGAQRLRCSDDLGTGSAGLLLALSDDPGGALIRVLGLPTRKPGSV